MDTRSSVNNFGWQRARQVWREGTLHRRAMLALALAFGSVLLVALAIVVGRLASGDGLKSSVRAAAITELRFLKLPSGQDSWAPMVSAHLRLIASPGSEVYATTLHDDHCKFQYPPSSLLLLDLLPSPGIERLNCEGLDETNDPLSVDAWPAKRWIDAASRAALFGTIAVAAWLLHQVLLRSSPSVRRGETLAVASLVLLTGLAYYPLLKAYGLGQIQVGLTFMTALAIAAMFTGRQFVAGLLIGFCVLIKPQLAVLLVWALVRRQGAFAGGLLLVAAAGNGLALWRYGWVVHLEYLQTLSMLSRLGESYWPNQSVNGLLNRLLLTGSPVLWNIDGFPAYHPLVRFGTLLSSLLILAVGLWHRGPLRSDLARCLDLCVMVAACTLASPIAWEHHFGVFFVLFAVALAVALVTRWAAGLVVLAVAYPLTATAMLVPEVLFINPWLGLSGSHLWFGAMLLFGVLVVLRHRLARALGSFDRMMAEPGPERPAGDTERTAWQ